MLLFLYCYKSPLRGKTKTRMKFEFSQCIICSLASDAGQLACRRAACDRRTRLALRPAVARLHHSANTGCSRAAGLAAARRDWQLAASRPASTQLSQLWAARPDVLARLSPRGGGLLPVASTLSSVLRHLQESRYGVNLQFLQHKMISWRVSLRVPCSSAVCVCVCLPLCQWSVRLSCARNFVSLN